MDVALGQEYMPISAKNLLLIFAVLLSTLLTGMASAKSKDEAPLHWSGEKTVWDRKNNRVELFGKAAVHQLGESLVAEYIMLDLNTRTLNARGKCIYSSSGTIMYGEEMYFNLDTRTGVIIAGKVSGEQFTLSGERINRLGPTHFQTHKGEYSTCFDCPNSWTLGGRDVDMEMGGYALMESVTLRAFEAPVAWSPTLMIPIKTQRQTGFLFPRPGGNKNTGAFLLVPFFWAPHKSFDATVVAGQVTKRGFRSEWEGRYALTTRSSGQANFYYFKDDYFNKTFNKKLPARHALNLVERQELLFGVDQKLRIVTASDNLITNGVTMPGVSLPDNGGAYLTSEAMVSRSGVISGYVAAKRYQSFLQGMDKTMDPEGDIVGEDRRTVQAMPTASLNMNDYFIFNSPIAFGMTTNYTKFNRRAGLFDVDAGMPKQITDPQGRIILPGRTTEGPELGVDPIRKAERFIAIPMLYTTLRPTGYFSIVPSVQYRNYFYYFPQGLPSLQRAYPLFQTEISTQLEKIYDTADPDIPRIKHLFRPALTYSRIPPKSWIREPDDHPFVKQIRNSQLNGFSGMNFDSNDIIPINPTYSYTNYFAPLGNSLTSGFTTQLIRRRGRLDAGGASYQQMLELRANQTYNFSEPKKPLSLFDSHGVLTLDKISATSNYYYLPYAPVSRDEKGRLKGRQNFDAAVSYTFINAFHQGVLAYERSVSLAYTNATLGAYSSRISAAATFSINDYIMPKAAWGYEFTVAPKDRMRNVAGLLRLQNPSRCWRIDLGASAVPQEGGTFWDNITYTAEFALNLTGGGFSTLTDTFAGIATRGGQ